MKRLRSQKSFYPKAGHRVMRWHVIDADNAVLGRLASRVALILRGKTKPSYTPGVDCGDGVIVINAAKVKLTGDKRQQKTYYRHTGYPGGIKSQTAAQILEGKFPERVVEKAIVRMIPRGPLSRQILQHLRVYANDQHPHQDAKELDFKNLNRKNAG